MTFHSDGVIYYFNDILSYSLVNPLSYSPPKISFHQKARLDCHPTMEKLVAVSEQGVIIIFEYELSQQALIDIMK